MLIIDQSKPFHYDLRERKSLSIIYHLLLEDGLIPMGAKQFLSLGLCSVLMATSVSFASVNVDAVSKATEETTTPAKTATTTTPVKTTTTTPVKTTTTTTPAKATTSTPAKTATTPAPAKTTTATPAKPAAVVPVAAVKTYSDGVYRGIFIDGAEMQVNVDFELRANVVVAAKYRYLFYKGIDYRKEATDVKVMEMNKQYVALLNYLVGKDIRTALKDLYVPGNIVTTTAVDGVTGATLKSGKVISAINDALNRGVYSLPKVTTTTTTGETLSTTSTTLPAVATAKYENGIYRGVFLDSGEAQVGVEIELKDNKVASAKYRQLFYKAKDYKNEKEDTKVMALTKQYTDLLASLVGKDVNTAINSLYKPGDIVKDTGVDGMTGATLKSGKVISALRDALNRGVYSYPK